MKSLALTFLPIHKRRSRLDRVLFAIEMRRSLTRSCCVGPAPRSPRPCSLNFLGFALRLALPLATYLIRGPGRAVSLKSRMESTKTPTSKQPILVLLAAIAASKKRCSGVYVGASSERVLTGIVDATESDRSLPFR
jgi:hypothetical protein